MQNQTYIIDYTDENKRIDLFLSSLIPEVSRSQIQNFIKKGQVSLNGKPVKPSYSLKENDIITCQDIKETVMNILPQNIPLNIVWEDENMLVVNKPSGMLTHPTTTEKENTLVNALKYKYGENLSNVNGDFRRGIVHRLDRNTSGLLMVAKNNDAHEFIANQIKTKTAIRQYLAVVKGSLIDEMVLDYPIGRNISQPHKMDVVYSEKSKPSLTELRVLKNFGSATYVELTLKTGRTHQIRVHMSHIGHPVFNDTLYGFGKMKINTQEQVLQAYKLKFAKPFSGEIIELEIEPDEKIKRVLNYLGQKE